ncbi:MAG: redox-sensing transcriptional repressor Rex [Anaerolineae bacterium]|jgi:redox-sensing transcriptional repressor
MVDAQVDIPRPSLARLPAYLRRLIQAIELGESVISSQALGEAAGVPAAQVRKDLSHLGELGRAGIGYEVEHLASVLHGFLGLGRAKRAVVVGAGNLGRALAAYPGFARYGLRIVALFDVDPAKIGRRESGREVYALDRLPEVVRQESVDMGILTVPADQAQDVADLMIEAGIEVIWNFAPQALQVPDHVFLQYEDLAARLAIISYHIARRAEPESISNGRGESSLPA